MVADACDFVALGPHFEARGISLAFLCIERVGISKFIQLRYRERERGENP